jgi:hypothetical protein
MGYDITLLDPDTHECINDGIECPVSITFNYVWYYKRVFNSERGIRRLYGMTAEQTIPILEFAISKLPNNKDPNYWIPTGGNAKEPLKKLLEIAKLHPKGIWDGD